MDPEPSLLLDYIWLFPAVATAVGIVFYLLRDSPLEPFDLAKTIQRIDAQGSRRRILVADDSLTIQKVIELTFMDQDIHVTSVSEGPAAVVVLNQRRFDLVVADFNLPGINDYEVCVHSKKLYPDMPVLLMAGTFEDFDERIARQAGANRWIKKPFDSKELLAAVDKLWAAGRQG